jgi:hypothetical protein
LDWKDLGIKGRKEQEILGVILFLVLSSKENPLEAY